MYLTQLKKTMDASRGALYIRTFLGRSVRYMINSFHSHTANEGHEGPVRIQ
jgi:hypothetical protein